MTHPGSAPCECPCCGQAECKCKDCHCKCCKHRSGTTSAQQQEAGGQQPPCRCACCEKKSCECKQQSDCSCTGCEKHVCPCPLKAEKKATEACDCCCCKTDNPGCTESRHHQQSCECRCCRGNTCAPCKSKQAGASVPGAQPAAGKILFNVAHDSNISPESSGSRSYCPAASSSCNSCRHWISTCRNTRRHCMSGTRNHTQCCTCRILCCCNSITERQCDNTDGQRRTDETVNNSSVSCIPRQSTDCPSCCCLSNFPCCFFAPHFVYRGGFCKQHGSCCWPPVHAYDGVRCCSGHISSTCWCCTSMKGATVGTPSRPLGAAAVVDCSQPSEKSESAAFPQGGSSSSSKATAHDRDAAHPSEHLDTPESEVSCGRCNCKRQCILTRDVAAEEHELQRQQRFKEYAVEQQPGRRANQEEQQRQEYDEGQKSDSCILDPEGRLLIECKTKEKVLLRRMQPTDYATVRALLPRVSRCTVVLTDQQVHDILSSSVFYAWCCFTVEPKQPLPHAEKEQREVEGQMQKLADQHQTKEQQQQLRQRQQQGRQLQQVAMEDRPEFYRETKLVAYCELVLQPRLGRKTDGRLERVVVDEAFCGRGLASQMCSAVLAAVKERGLCGFVDLTVEKDEARHIYEDKLGFRKVETTVLRRQL